MRSEYFEEKDDCLVIDKGVCRTAPATPGLLITVTRMHKNMINREYEELFHVILHFAFFFINLELWFNLGPRGKV